MVQQLMVAHAASSSSTSDDATANRAVGNSSSDVTINTDSLISIRDIPTGRNRSSNSTHSGSNSSTADVALNDDDDNDNGAGSLAWYEELMTSELVAQIEHRPNDCLAPMHVHMVWIGDISQAPADHTKFTKMGYNLTVHTSADEILDGFHPYVRKAYRLALPRVVGFDFLKLALLYKFGGLAVDADTFPAIAASELQLPAADCDVVFGKEVQVSQEWQKPIFRAQGGPTYGLNRPFQVLNWAMAASTPRSRHIRWLLNVAMAHFVGLRDMEFAQIQDVAGSGIISDYVALVYEHNGHNYQDVYRDETKYVPVERLCLVDVYFRGGWIHHSFLSSWKQSGVT